MTVRKANAQWNGDLKQGNGTVSLGSGAYEGPYSFQSRFESGSGTNPEELIAAAHAGCYSMALAHALSSAGHKVDSVRTTARVHLAPKDGGFTIPRIELESEARVDGINDAEFQEIAQQTKTGCPVSQALSAVEIILNARLA